MSRENAEIVAGGYEVFRATGAMPVQLMTDDFVWDMSHFRGWPEQQLYEGIQGTAEFFAVWGSSWEDWEVELEELHEAGELVVAIVRQRGRSKLSGMPLEMSFAQVWTLREGKEARMDMYSDPDEALRAVGLKG